MTQSTSEKAAAPPLPSPKERRRLREALSLTEDQVASAVGVTRATVRAWETGRSSPRGRKREAYARLIGAVAAAPAPPAPPAPPPPVPVEAPGSVAMAATEPDEAVEPEAVEPDGAVEAEAAVVPEAPEEPPGDPDPGHAPDAPAAAFDALYQYAASALFQQTYLLTGQRALSRAAVTKAFELAWERWPEVAVDRDPVGWVRAAAYEYAMSPWRRLNREHRRLDPPPEAPASRALLDALLALPPSYRRTLVLHDGVGLGLPETAAETEAST
ncbi:helix-turn-helix domain-containing protein, partial [Streptomyces sp. SID2563]|uniref:helix-turn-helix domain-containing protein n=2 Tax=unclassified Streptomyces TaxID=2593676 RepID=UPI0019267883